MKHIGKVKQQAFRARKIYQEFFRGFSSKEILNFCASFHLRPTSSCDISVISTLSYAPMRGIQVSPEELELTLPKLRKVANSDQNELAIFKKIGFLSRKSESSREENAQAALIRKLVLQPEEFDGMRFVASEFELFADELPRSRSDILAFRDGVLYDIELKNKRLTETVKQTARYVAYFTACLSKYADCISYFPNSVIGRITDIRGITLVPHSDNSMGSLEKCCQEKGIGLWTFDKNDQYRIRRIIAE